jgi:hypothetical protein
MISDPTLGAVIPDTRLHPIYLITETAAALRQAVPYLAVTVIAHRLGAQRLESSTSARKAKRGCRGVQDEVLVGAGRGNSLHAGF